MSNESITVTNDADYRTALNAGYKPENIKISAPDNSAAIEAARREGVESGKADGLREGRELGATAERERVKGINDLHVAGFEAERDAAVAAGTSIADYAVVQAKAIKDRGITVDAMKRDSKGAPHAAPGDPTAGASSWDRIVDRHKAKAKAA
ncbi:MAG: hypothetical protein J0I77_17795 [Rudaea sp.]|uniref:hypothetical protein n=1 Tax=unclassified Rudaea TaxID=2627037 RepID=UPI0010F866EC|nr:MULTISPECIES: hypothetical protein [unclassified Rudaea]MBN8887582.1 hypothetical protein [Rudaea sp.]